jgi:anaerobic ribonucleoside-triphosphate reductase activating protein
MGGDQNIEELNSMLSICKARGLKTCVYSGCDTCAIFDLSLLDYLKVGPYKKEFGPLNDRSTNQIFYEVSNGILENSTKLFWRNGKLED